MDFDLSTLEPHIREILSAPGTDLSTISAKKVRKQLIGFEPVLTAEFLRENKHAVDAIIAGVFDEVSAQAARDGIQVFKEEEALDARAAQDGVQEVKEEEFREDEHLKEEEALDEDEAREEVAVSLKRKTSDETDEDAEAGQDAEGDGDVATPPPKKAKRTRELSDAELARQLSSQLNGRTRSAGSKTRGSTNGSTKKPRKLKSAAMVDTDDDDSDVGSGRKKSNPKKKVGGASAKGGFAKEYTLSEPLAALLNVDKLSRPQVVKQLWIYIKGNELQNPNNKREILCDGAFKAIFKVEKIGMFEMNRVLGQHLHEREA